MAGMLLENKVAVITGGGSGIGRATALAFVKEGAKVVVADVLVEGGEETVRLIKHAGGEAVFVKCNVTQATDVMAMVDAAIVNYGRLDCAFNNAGVNGELASFSKFSEESWDKIIDINLKGVFLCMKYEIPRILKSGGGAIVNTSSIAGLVGATGNPAYVASKHGVIGLTKGAAMYYAKAGIRVNAVCPGGIETPMVGDLVNDPKMRDIVMNLQPVGRLGTPEEVAHSVVFLCSDHSSFITGHALAVDGGIVAQ